MPRDVTVVSYTTQAGVGIEKTNNGTFYLEVGWLLLYYVDGGRANKDICLYKRKQHTTKGNCLCIMQEGVFITPQEAMEPVLNEALID